MKIYITSGPSGSGKSTYYENNKEKLNNPVLVCPDNIRELLFGDVSIQKEGEKVWRIAYEKMYEAIREKQDVYFSATFCSYRFILEVLKKIDRECYKEEERAEVVILRFKDGEDLNLLEERVKKDLEQKKNRSNTLMVNEKSETVIQKQRENFLKIDFERIKKSSKWLKNIYLSIKNV